MAGCATARIEPAPCPPRPVLRDIDIPAAPELDALAEDVAYNVFILKHYAKRLEVRASCE